MTDRKPVPGDKVAWWGVIKPRRRRYGTVVETTADRMAVIRTDKGGYTRVHLDKLTRVGGATDKLRKEN